MVGQVPQIRLRDVAFALERGGASGRQPVSPLACEHLPEWTLTSACVVPASPRNG